MVTFQASTWTSNLEHPAGASLRIRQSDRVAQPALLLARQGESIAAD